MRFWVPVSLLLLFTLLPGCIQQNGFDAYFLQTKTIMERNGAFLPTALLPPTVDQINRTQIELGAFQSSVSRQAASKDREALFGFLTAQNHLLEMQKQFFLGREELSFTDFSRPSCNRESNMGRAISHYELAELEGDLAQKNFTAFASNYSPAAARTQIDFEALERDIELGKQTFAQLKATTQKFCA